MDEKLFVICEVKKVDERLPPDMTKVNFIYEGEIWFTCVIPKELLIPASRLREAKPKQGERYFSPDSVLGPWQTAHFDHDKDYDQPQYILDPPPEEKSDWDKWVDDFADFLFNGGVQSIDKVKDLLQRMPRRES